jgi:hypothetical protein
LHRVERTRRSFRERLHQSKVGIRGKCHIDETGSKRQVERLSQILQATEIGFALAPNGPAEHQGPCAGCFVARQSQGPAGPIDPFVNSSSKHGVADAFCVHRRQLRTGSFRFEQRDGLVELFIRTGLATDPVQEKGESRKGCACVPTVAESDEGFGGFLKRDDCLLGSVAFSQNFSELREHTRAFRFDFAEQFQGSPVVRFGLFQVHAEGTVAGHDEVPDRPLTNVVRIIVRTRCASELQRGGVVMGENGRDIGASTRTSPLSAGGR